MAIGIATRRPVGADRPLMARLAPPRYYGQFFGLYSMVGRFAAIIGPIMWALIVEFAGLGTARGRVFLLLWVVVAFLVLRPVDDRPRAWGPEDLPGFVDSRA